MLVLILFRSKSICLMIALLLLDLCSPARFMQCALYACTQWKKARNPQNTKTEVKLSRRKILCSLFNKSCSRISNSCSPFVLSDYLTHAAWCEMLSSSVSWLYHPNKAQNHPLKQHYVAFSP